MAWIAARYLLVPLVFGLGGPLVHWSGPYRRRSRDRRPCASPGPRRDRFVIAKRLGLWPPFSRRLAVPVRETRRVIPRDRPICAVGPFYGSSVLGLHSISASQAPTVWPLCAGLLRLAIAVTGAWYDACDGPGDLSYSSSRSVLGLRLWPESTPRAVKSGGWSQLETNTASTTHIKCAGGRQSDRVAAPAWRRSQECC